METKTESQLEKGVQWLLSIRNPAITYWTLRDLADHNENEPEVRYFQSQIAAWKPVTDLLSQQHPKGYWAYPEDCYWPKWRATVWPLILLAELGLPSDHPAVKAGCEYFLQTAMGQDKSWPPPDYPDPGGWRLLWEPCVTGNMARTLIEFGYEDDPRLQEMLRWLIENQLPDGGWNCEFGPWGVKVHHSSFMSTIEPLWAFSALEPSKWPKGTKDAVAAGCEFLLMHHLYKSDHTFKIINEEWTKLHFPMFYFYDMLHGLRVVTSLGYLQDARAADALQLLRSKRRNDGTWPLEATFVNQIKHNFVRDASTGEWHAAEGENIAQIPEIYQSLGEVGGPNPWVSLNALRVLKNLG